VRPTSSPALYDGPASGGRSRARARLQFAIARRCAAPRGSRIALSCCTPLCLAALDCELHVGERALVALLRGQRTFGHRQNARRVLRMVGRKVAACGAQQQRVALRTAVLGRQTLVNTRRARGIAGALQRLGALEDGGSPARS